MPGVPVRADRLRDLVLLFLTGLFGIPGVLVLVVRIVSVNTLFALFGSTLTGFIAGSLGAALVCGVLYVILPPPSCHPDPNRRIRVGEGYRGKARKEEGT